MCLCSYHDYHSLLSHLLFLCAEHNTFYHGLATHLYECYIRLQVSQMIFRFVISYCDDIDQHVNTVLRQKFSI